MDCCYTRFLEKYNLKGVPKEWPESSGGEMNIHKCSPQEGGSGLAGYGWLMSSPTRI